MTLRLLLNSLNCTMSIPLEFIYKRFQSQLLKSENGAGEMAQWLRALIALPKVLSSNLKGPEFKSQQPHGGSQPP